MQENVPSKIRLWLMAIRPKTLPAAVGPVAVVGTYFIQSGHLTWVAILAAVPPDCPWYTACFFGNWLVIIF